jgi:hypothetical protein
VKLDDEDGVAAGDEPDGVKGSKVTVTFFVAAAVREGATGGTLKYPLTTPGPAFVIAVVGEITALAAPEPLAFAESLQAPGPAEEAIFREFCTVVVGVLMNFTL